MVRTVEQEIHDQGLMDGLIRGIYQRIDDTADYHAMMMKGAMLILMEIECKGAGRVDPSPFKFSIEKIDREAKSEAERKYLHMLLLDRVLNSVRSGIVMALLRETLQQWRDANQNMASD